MIQRWRAADPVVADVLLALACAMATILTIMVTDQSPHPPNLDGPAVLLILGSSLPVAVRRTHPVGAWFVAGMAAYLYGTGEFPDTVDFGTMAVLYSIAADAPRRTANILGLVTAAWITVALLGVGDADARDVYFVIVLYAGAWAIGEHQRTRHLYTAHLEERAARLEQERAEAERRAVSEERARIAHELHDLVAHHVSMMVVQAEGGASVVGTSADKAAQAFDAISASGRQAMAEMRRVLGVLREEDGGGGAAAGGADRAPQPGLDAVDALVEGVRQTGLAVEVRREGTPRSLPPGVDLSAYRIVQEALTNTVRHADARRATLVIRYRDDALELEVVDDGRGAAAGGSGGAGSGGGGHGLVGMRERVVLFGGELSAGPANGGGFSVVARLPTAS